jgi:pimeloyl-ACP methyl ester carboxylesterase
MARKRSPRKPLALKTMGYLYAGGRIDRKLEGSPMVGQMYAEYFVPKTLRAPYPIVMIHGNWQTGTNFTGTPDGREGWAQYFLRRGYAVYIVDQVARGRSPDFSHALGPVGPANLARTVERFTAPQRSKLWPQATRHTQWPGSGKAGDRYFDAFYATQCPSLVSNETSQTVNCEGAAALLDTIGPAIVLTHSQSGAYSWLIGDARPKLVKALVAIEPSGPPVYDTALLGSPKWFEDTGPRKPYGLTFAPLAYDPPLRRGQALSFVRQDKPDAPGLVRGWLQKEPARKLAKLTRIPVLIVVAEASYHAAYDHCTAAYLAQAGVPTTFIRLEDVGLRGNGHMMMLEKNSDAVAGVIEGWLRKAVKAKPRRAAR